jgi:hypothetical protein
MNTVKRTRAREKGERQPIYDRAVAYARGMISSKVFTASESAALEAAFYAGYLAAARELALQNGFNPQIGDSE